MDDSKMDIDVPANTLSTGITKDKPKPQGKSHDIYTTTIKAPPYAYAHLELITTTAATTALDNLQVRAYLSSALKQFLGLTGSGMPIDILKVDGTDCWVRVPRQDLGAFAAALAVWPGSGGAVTGFLVRAAGDWLGALVGRRDQEGIWGDS